MRIHTSRIVSTAAAHSPRRSRPSRSRSRASAAHVTASASPQTSGCSAAQELRAAAPPRSAFCVRRVFALARSRIGRSARGRRGPPRFARPRRVRLRLTPSPRSRRRANPPAPFAFPSRAAALQFATVLPLPPPCPFHVAAARLRRGMARDARACDEQGRSPSPLATPRLGRNIAARFACPLSRWAVRGGMNFSSAANFHERPDDNVTARVRPYRRGCRVSASPVRSRADTAHVALPSSAAISSQANARALRHWCERAWTRDAESRANQTRKGPLLRRTTKQLPNRKIVPASLSEMYSV